MKRVPQLDILRAFAVLAVIAYHAFPIFAFGWAGVDLFFVLSGFLISGLLFNEISEKGTISIPTFLVRRGFKIYPAYYSLLAFCWILDPFRHSHWYLPQVLFYQNYHQNILAHTWSLAVEEHFYLGLPLLLLLLTKTGKLNWIPGLTAGSILLCALLRFRLAIQPVAPNVETVMFPTHLRFDALLVGVCVAYFLRSRPRIWECLKSPILIPVAIALLAPIFFVHRESRFIVTLGLVGTELGFAILLVRAICATHWRSPLLEQLGSFSYSIYLWHPIVLMACPRTVLGGIVGSILSLSIGITAAACIEHPALELRDKWMRARISPRFFSTIWSSLRTEPR